MALLLEPGEGVGCYESGVPFGGLDCFVGAGFATAGVEAHSVSHCGVFDISPVPFSQVDGGERESLPSSMC